MVRRTSRCRSRRRLFCVSGVAVAPLAVILAPPVLTPVAGLSPPNAEMIDPAVLALSAVALAALGTAILVLSGHRYAPTHSNRGKRIDVTFSTID